jgi:hypothetical protein
MINNAHVKLCLHYNHNYLFMCYVILSICHFFNCLKLFFVIGNEVTFDDVIMARLGQTVGARLGGP